MKVSKYASMPLLFIEQNIKNFPEAAMQYHYITSDEEEVVQVPNQDESTFHQMEVLKKIKHLRSLMEKLPKVICLIKTARQEHRGKIVKVTNDTIELQISGKIKELATSDIEDLQIISF